MGYYLERNIDMSEIKLQGYQPGAIGRITELHGTFYSQHWGFDLFFEAKVATEMAEFLSRFNETRDGFWLALVDGQIAGSIAIDGINTETKGAHLRWFIVDSSYHGMGIGNQLLGAVVEFCKQAGHQRIYLWTFAGLDKARHLYEKWGFALREEFEGDQWGQTVTEQRFEIVLE